MCNMIQSMSILYVHACIMYVCPTYVHTLSVHTILHSILTHIRKVYGIVIQEEEQLSSKVVIKPEIHSSSDQIVPVTTQGDPVEESSGNITSSEVCTYRVYNAFPCIDNIHVCLC